MPKIYTYISCIDDESFDVLEREMIVAAGFLSTEDDGDLLGTIEEVQDLMALSRRSDKAVRFHDGGFPITTAWRWLGDGVGVAHMIVRGTVGQIHLMLSGTETEERAVARAWLKLANVVPDTALPPVPTPSLITLERKGYADEGGGYLLGMILIAPFCESCGVPDDQK
jgi:hypothetical protein